MKEKILTGRKVFLRQLKAEDFAEFTKEDFLRKFLKSADAGR